MTFKRFKLFGLFLLAVSIVPHRVSGQALDKRDSSAYHAYLFAYFTGNAKSEEAIRFAISSDGYHYLALNKNQPILNSNEISSTGGVRDPHILRGKDGSSFYMVATDMVSAKGWDSNRGMVLMRSADLIHWTSSKINIAETFPDFAAVNRVWAPQTIYDPLSGKYMVYFSMRAGSEPDKIYYAYANADFTALESAPRQLFFNTGGGACIDGDIINKDGRYYLFFKTENAGSGIKIAVSDQLTKGYVLQDRFVQQTTDPVEGSGVFKLNEGPNYILMYDLYTKGRYQFTRSADLSNFKVIDNEISMNFHPRHGTVMPITSSEAKRLLSQWMPAEDILTGVRAKGLMINNIVLDTAQRKLFLPFLPGTDLRRANLRFPNFPGVQVSPVSDLDLARGAVDVSVSIPGKEPAHFQVSALLNHNPVLPGYYADPEVLYAEKTRKFYIYPTSDGFQNWSGTYFKAFSSPDLVDWKDEGIILDLGKDVTWAKRNAWAPSIVEKKVSGAYRYYYYFTAGQKIGVAVANDPLGPFTDSGKPLIESRPEGATGGQQIDPAVFTDPKTGKSYLFYGNGYMAGAELNEDMMSIKAGTTILLTPDKTFREGSYVFYRQGKYYILWSENDTRSPDYGVRYGTSDSPLGKITVPKDNLILSKDIKSGIYGTGHNAILQLPGQDKWYIVYHRFTYPSGIRMGQAAGFNREVCIDQLRFNEDGSIIPVKPTHAGVPPVKIK